jgi:para-nitrobenzyl esterase
MRMLGLEGFAQHEDCLTLQVWTPAIDGARRPVLVWLHGGGFTAGAGSLPLFDGATLARRGDVVVVTLNYRLGALGFLAHPDLQDAGEVGANFGLLDQIAALEWVREHASALGGDPGIVTLFGESAGAMSFGALLGAPAARGLFHRAILQSGAAHNVSSRANGLHVAELFRAAIGQPDAPVEVLRTLPVDAILAAQGQVIDQGWRQIEGLAFQPTVDGAVLPRAARDAIGAGDARDVALLVGTNLDEWRLFALTDPKLRTMDEAGLLRRLVRVPPEAAGDADAFAQRAAQTYRSARQGGATDPASLWLAMQTDRVFRIPALRVAELQLRATANVHAYLCDWASPALDGALGSCHGIELPFVFGTHRDPRAVQLVGSGPEADQLATAIQDAWLAFARSGDPGWPAYDVAKRATQRLGRESGLDFDPQGAERAFWDGLL